MCKRALFQTVPLTRHTRLCDKEAISRLGGRRRSDLKTWRQICNWIKMLLWFLSLHTIESEGLLEVLQLKPTHAEIKPMNMIYKTLGTLRLKLGDLLGTWTWSTAEIPCKVIGSRHSLQMVETRRSRHPDSFPSRNHHSAHDCDQWWLLQNAPTVCAGIVSDIIQWRHQFPWVSAVLPVSDR